MSEYYSEHVVKGRRTYECTFCRGPIAKGAQHVTISFGSGGEYSNYRAHIECHAAVTRDTRQAAAVLTAQN